VENNVLIQGQNYFRRNKSTERASQTFIEAIQKAPDRGFYAIRLFFDLSRACNEISYDILSDKLNLYGTRGSNLWFRLYLSDQFKFAEIKAVDCSHSFKNNYISSCLKVQHDVPKGCVLGRLVIFAIYIYK
jgi:hypothetical protein